jgi:translation initiation factor 2 beta subunit (eIF-2beta)/eIF-5
LKLIKDQEVQANVYYEELKKFPNYNKIQFERAEGVYFLESLKRQALGMAGAKSSLINMLDDHRCLENFKEAYAKLPKDQQHLLEQITNETMKNYMPNEVDGKTISSSQYIAEQKHGEK